MHVSGGMKNITLAVMILLTAVCAVAQTVAPIQKPLEQVNSATKLYVESRPPDALLPRPAEVNAFRAEPYIAPRIEIAPPPAISEHKFFDKRNRSLFEMNVVAETLALFSIQSHGKGIESRGRTLDPFEKHFESYGYGWGAVYRYGGGVGLNTLVTYVFHAYGHHKMERWVPLVAIGHAEASTGYALTGSRQGSTGW